MRYCGIIMKLQYGLTPFRRIVKENGRKVVPHGRFSGIYYFEDYQNLCSKPKQYSETMFRIHFFVIEKKISNFPCIEVP